MMPDDPNATPPPGGQPQALTDQERQWGDESDAYLRALLDAHTPAKQRGGQEFPGRCLHCSYTREPCDIASAAATALVRSDALDEARARLAAVETERDQAVEALDKQIRRLQVAIERARDFPCPECGHRLVAACAHDVSEAAEPAPTAEEYSNG